jgi:hypothetical protein
VTLRVPAAGFADALAGLRSLGRVRVDNTNAEDVTRVYTDLEIRLAVKRDLVGRLRALLTNRNARLTDLVAVERELGRAVTELEQMEGERRFLEHQVAMSTIHATFFVAPVTNPGGFLDPVAVAVREAFVVLGRSVGTLISALIFAMPWIAIAGLAWGVVRRVRRRAPVAHGPNT